MQPSTKLLGFAGMLSAPFFLFEMLALNGHENTSLSGLFDFVFMLGWMCSIAGMLRQLQPDTKKIVAKLLYLQLASLCVANVYNVWVIINPYSHSLLFKTLDLFWPLSNVLLFVLSIVLAANSVFDGWRRWAALYAGLWLPATMLVGSQFGMSQTTFWVSGIHSLLAWAAMGFAVIANKTPAVRLAT